MLGPFSGTLRTLTTCPLVSRQQGEVTNNVLWKRGYSGSGFHYRRRVCEREQGGLCIKESRELFSVMARYTSCESVNDREERCGTRRRELQPTNTEKNIQGATETSHGRGSGKIDYHAMGRKMDKHDVRAREEREDPRSEENVGSFWRNVQTT